MKRTLALVLVIATLLSIVPASASATNTPGEVLGTIKIYSGGYPMEYLAVNGKVQKQEYTYFGDYNPATGETNEIPAYCVTPNKYGVPQTVGAGESIEYLAEEAASDPKIVGLVANMYPHRSLYELKLDSLHQAFYAGKIALWCYLIPEWDISKVTVNPKLTGEERTRAEKILAATIDIYNRGMTWSSVPKPKLDTTPDRATAYPVTVDGKQYKQQIFTVTSDTWVCDYKVKIGFSSPDDVPAGTRITDLSNKDIDTVIVSPGGGSYNGKFKVLYPAESVEGESGSVQFSLNAEVYQYAVFYALCQEKDKYGNLQDYLADTDPQTVLQRSAVSTFDAPATPPDGDTPDTGLEILKLEEGTDTPLAGAAFEVKAPTGDVIGTYTTGYDGKITIPLVVVGNYTVTEVTPPKFHLLSNNPTQSVTVKYGEIAKVSFHNAPYGELRLEKIDEASGAGLPGAVLQLKNIKTGVVQTVTTMAAGIAQVSELPPGSYEVRELAAPIGYIKSDEVKTVQVKPGQVSSVTFKNQSRPGLRITKYDAATMTTLPGVTFEVYRDAALVGEYTTDALGEIVLRGIEPGTYLVKEIAAPGSHVVNSTPQQIEVKAGSTTLVELAFFNELKPGISLIKVDAADMRPLANAKFLIQKVGDTFSKEYTSGVDGKIDLSELTPGAYTVREIVAPDGYLIDDSTRTIQLNPGENAHFVFTDTIKPSLSLVKLSSDGTPLSGVTFRIAKIQDGSHYLDRTTDKNGEIRIDGLEPGVYSVRETATREDHLIDLVEHHVELFPGQTSTIVLSNNRRPSLVIHKNDADTGSPVEGAVFTVKAADGHTITEVKTGPDGTATLTNLLPIVYEVTEKFVPAPYLLDAPAQLITLYPNRTGHVYFENHKKPSLVIEKRDSITGDLLQGAKFQVWYASNSTSTGELNSLGTYFTDENGKIELSGLRDGWYKVTEVEPPTGYAIKEPATQECYIKGGEGKLLTFKNTPLNALVIKKVSATTGEVLQGAKFRVNYLSGVSGTGGTTIGEYTTSANGTIVVTGLKAGTYVVQEIQAPAGFILDDAPKTVYLAGNAQDVVTVEFADQPNSGLTIAKLDGRTGEPLAGAVFEVKSSAGGVVGNENGRYTTDQSGLIHFPDLPSDSYVITELTAPAGYVLNATPQTVKLVHGETHLVKCYNYPEGGLLITKLDSVTLEPLAGVKFEVKDSAGTVVGDTNGIFKTDSRGTIHIPNLKPGTYVVREVETLDGYQLDTTPQSIKIADSRLYTLEFLNVPNGGLTVSKLDSQTKAPLTGAIFEVRDSRGAPVGGSNGQYTTDASGTVNLPNLPADTYTVKEIQAPEGYTLDGTPQTVKLTGGKTEKLIFYNEAKGGLLVKKLDSVTKEPLSGVKFEVTTSDGTKVGPANGVYVTDSQGSFLIPGLAPGSYVVRETQAKDGYLLNDTPQTIEIKDHKLYTLEFLNTPTGGLLVKKLDSVTKEPLSGVKFEVTTSDGTKVGPANGVYVTDSQGSFLIPNLAPGTYVVRETQAKDGYALDSTPQTVEIKDNKTYTLEFLNTPHGGLTITKLDSRTRTPLAGAIFEVRDSRGAPIIGSNGQYTTDASGTIHLTDLPADTYTVKELKAPEGYTHDGTPQTVKLMDGKTEALTFYNTPMGGLLIKKLDSVTLSPLSGVKFEVTTSDGGKVGPANGIYTTDSQGTILISGLAPGTYVARETQAKPGYVLDDSAQTIAIKDSQLYMLEFRNTPDGGLRIVKLDEESRQPIKSVEFDVSAMDGARIGTYRTDAKGVIVLPSLESGWYAVTETKAAAGYELDSEPHNIEVINGKIATLEVTNRKQSSVLLHKIDSVTGKGIQGVTFLVSDAKGNPVGQYTTDQSGYIYIDHALQDGKYTIREIQQAEGYILDTQPKTFYVEYGGTSEITWKNTPVMGQIQVLKKSADDNPINGLPAGSLLEGARFEISDKAGNVVDTIVSDKNGLASSKLLPLGRYTVREVQAPAYYSVTDTTATVYLEFSGQIVRLEVTNKSVSTGVSITKTGPKEAMSGQPVRYLFSGIANTSTVPLGSFYVRDYLPTAVRLDKVVTGSYNKLLNYKIVYRVNGGEYRTLADSLSTSKTYTFDASPAALGLASNERVTEIMFVFGQVPAGFAQVEAPALFCTAVPGLVGGTSFTNTAEVGGVYNGQWIQAVTRWVTTVYGKPVPLPRTGY